MLLLILGLSASLLAESSERPSVHVVDNVRPVCDPEQKGPARLLVYVVDHEGRPMEGITTEAGPIRGQDSRVAQTDDKGLAEFSFEGERNLRVTATFVGFLTSVAENVHVTDGCLTGLLLPMQIMVPEEILEDSSTGGTTRMRPEDDSRAANDTD